MTTSEKTKAISALIEDLKSYTYPIDLNDKSNKDSNNTSSHVLDGWYELGRIFIRNKPAERRNK